jgi:parvulin-like peptidyl-prolyl isomerase
MMRLHAREAPVLVAVVVVVAGLAACGKDSAQPAPAEPAAAAKPTTPAAAPAAPAAAAPTAAAAPDADEACGQMILVSYAGASHAKTGVTRDKAAAQKRANELLAQVNGGSDFAALAVAQSDAPSSAPRGGLFGTFKKATWPKLHAALRDPLFALAVGALAPAPVEAEYGFAVLRRCPVEKAHARHILIRYKGATGAGSEIKRTKAEAEQQAHALLKQLIAGADFAGLATANSEDGSAKRGGDIGVQPKGALAYSFERALFGLEPGERSDVVETEFGFHIIQRLPN